MRSERRRTSSWRTRVVGGGVAGHEKEVRGPPQWDLGGREVLGERRRRGRRGDADGEARRGGTRLWQGKLRGMQWAQQVKMAVGKRWSYC